MNVASTPYAVMAKRHDSKEELDFFPTPPWATRALCNWLLANDCIYSTDICWEPACGAGHMSRTLSEYFASVYETDINYYGCGVGGIDFLEKSPSNERSLTSWIITNPPFNKAEKFALRGLEVAHKGVGLLVRTSFLEGVGRYNNLFTTNPPSAVLQFSERVPMHKGRLDPKGSTATSYCWVIWRTPRLPGHTQLHWIKPCRRDLERVEDYNA
jgi:hypothetical protein